jgi:mycofactocin precursor peptide peptidase
VILSHLANRTSAEVPEQLLLIVPVGSTEQHGPHLPLGTDTIIASRLADELVRRLGARLAVIAPVVAIGASGEHQGFPGTLSIGTEVLTSVLVEIGRSACAPGPFGSVLFVNGHGGNAEALRNAGRILSGEGRRAYHWSPRLPGSAHDTHAGRVETSIMLHLAPHLVRTELAEMGNVQAISDLEPWLRRGGVKLVSANGVLGDPRGATPELGDELFTSFVDDLEAVARGLAL